MSFVYVFILPLCLGVMTIVAENKIRSWKYCLVAPWMTVTSCFAVALLVGWKGRYAF